MGIVYSTKLWVFVTSLPTIGISRNPFPEGCGLPMLGRIPQKRRTVIHEEDPIPAFLSLLDYSSCWRYHHFERGGSRTEHSGVRSLAEPKSNFFGHRFNEEGFTP